MPEISTPKFVTAATLCFIALVLILGALLMGSQVEMHASGYCNSGEIRFDVAADSIVQNHTCWQHRINETTGDAYYVPNPRKQNISCFDEQWVLDHASFQGIEGLNCKGEVETKMPFMLAWFMK